MKENLHWFVKDDSWPGLEGRSAIPKDGVYKCVDDMMKAVEEYKLVYK